MIGCWSGLPVGGPPDHSIAAQSPAAGVSRFDVNVIGLAAVPFATRRTGKIVDGVEPPDVPRLIENAPPVEWPSFNTTPGSIVSVINPPLASDSTGLIVM